MTENKIDAVSEDKGKTNNTEEPSNCENESNITIIEKRIKQESESDIDVVPKKKTKIEHIENSSQESYEETYPRVNVKQEPSTPDKIELLPADSITPAELNSTEDYVENSNTNPFDGIVTQEVHDTESEIEESESDEREEIEYKVDIGETVLIKQNHNYTVVNSSDNEDSEESDDEITSIKCEDDDDLYSKRSRLADRIIFKDEDDMGTSYDSGSDNEITKKLKLKSFAAKYPNLKLIEQNFDENTSVTPDDEIWIVKCPKDVNIKGFNNRKLKTDGKSKITVSGHTYQSSAEEVESDTISLLTMDGSEYKICNLPVNGIINLH